MKQIICSLLLFCCFICSGHHSPSGITKFSGEKLFYHLYLHGWPVATAYLFIDYKDSLIIRAAINTKPLAGLIFRIHNVYELLLDPGLERPIIFNKHIQQRNLSQIMKIRYDYESSRALANDTIAWHITPKTNNLFVMLYQLRCQPIVPGDTFVYHLDVESEPWRAKGMSRANNGTQFANQTSEVEIEFIFESEGTPFRRTWKTDLLTNRITKGGNLLILLGGAPQNIPLLIRFGEGEQSIEMRFNKRKQGDIW